jgi:hypothetical protein
MSVVNADHRRLIAAAVAELFGTGDVEAMAPLLREDVVDHRPGVAASKADWLAAARKVPLASMQLVVRLVLADGASVPVRSPALAAVAGALDRRGRQLAVPGRPARRARGGLPADPGDRPPTQRRWAGAVVTVGERLRGTRP